MEKHKISIIIANYNNSNNLSKTINSIIMQKYKNIEIIIVDDNSTDNSRDIIFNFSNKYDFIKYIFLSKNRGAYYARNEALKISSGDFITLLDSDDVYFGDFLSNNLDVYIQNEKEDKNFQILFSNIYRSMFTEMKLEDMNKLLELDMSKCKENNIDVKKNCFLGMATIFVKKTFFELYGMWRDDYYYGMDVELIQRYLVIKYEKFMNYEELWLNINSNKMSECGIKMIPLMNYISQPMNNNNATVKCNKEERNIIHKKCEEELKSDKYIVNKL